jgi:hypothetical protein
MKCTKIWLILGISLLFLFSCSTAEAITEVPGFTFLRSENIGEDVFGNRITKEYFKNDSIDLEIIIIPKVNITGTIVAVGSSMNIELIIRTDDNNVYFFRHEDKAAFWKKQGQEVSITARVEKRVIKNKKSGRTIRRNWIYPEK